MYRMLFSRIEHYIPNFSTLTKQRKLEIIVIGIFIDNEEIGEEGKRIEIRTASQRQQKS